MCVYILTEENKALNASPALHIWIGRNAEMAQCACLALYALLCWGEQLFSKGAAVN